MISVRPRDRVHLTCVQCVVRSAAVGGRDVLANPPPHTHTHPRLNRVKVGKSKLREKISCALLLWLHANRVRKGYTFGATPRPCTLTCVHCTVRPGDDGHVECDRATHLQ